MTEKISADEIKWLLDAFCAPKRPKTRDEYWARIVKIYGPIESPVVDGPTRLPDQSPIGEVFGYAEELMMTFPDDQVREAHLHSTIDGVSRLVHAFGGNLEQARRIIEPPQQQVASAA